MNQRWQYSRKISAAAITIFLFYISVGYFFETAAAAALFDGGIPPHLRQQSHYNEAICPPSAWISCGVPPNISGGGGAKTTPCDDLAPVNSDGAGSASSAGACCWVSMNNNSLPAHEHASSHWRSFDNRIAHEKVPYILGIQADYYSPDYYDGGANNDGDDDLDSASTAVELAAVLEFEYDRDGLAINEIVCSYYAQSLCSGGGSYANSETSPADDSREWHLAFRLRNTAPFRYTVPESYDAYVGMVVDGEGDDYCDCDNLFALPIEQRYRCCMWQASAIGGTASTIFSDSRRRKFTCRAPASRENEVEPQCSSVIRTVPGAVAGGSCGDTGGCFCRLEYSPLLDEEAREPWDCGGCCHPLLSGPNAYRLNAVESRNSTRLDCLATVFQTAPKVDFCSNPREAFVNITPNRGDVSSAGAAANSDLGPEDVVILFSITTAISMFIFSSA